MNKCAIISFCNNRGAYRAGMERLRQSLIGKVDADFLGFDGEESIGAPKHEDNPYAFKIYAIEKAFEMGYRQILWLDSSVFAIKNLTPIFDEIEKNGFIFQEAGHYLGNWSSDKQLEYFGITRNEAMEMPMIGNAGFLGLNFTKRICCLFFDQWRYSMLDGMFKGNWTNENNSESSDERVKGCRHDMVCSSAIMHNLNIQDIMKKGDEWLEYAAPGTLPKNETILLMAQGI